MYRLLLSIILLITLTDTMSASTHKEISLTERGKGTLVGLAIADAIGTTLEFTKRDTYEHLTDMVGGGPFKLKPGEWTDDTSMALCLAYSLVEKQGLNPFDLMKKFVAWWKTGYASSNGTCFDIGITTRESLHQFDETGTPFTSDTDDNKVGNGTIMRLAPVVLYYHKNLYDSLVMAAIQSRTTHGAAQSTEGAVLMALILHKALHGKNKAEVLTFTDEDTQMIDTLHRINLLPKVDLLDKLKTEDWKNKQRADIKSTGYVYHTLEAAMWCVYTTNSFKDAVLKAANLGDDADTVAAVTGQIAGALYGYEAIPSQWRARVVKEREISALTITLINKQALPKKHRLK